MSVVLPAVLSAGAAAVACAPLDRMRRLRAALPPPPDPGPRSRRRSAPRVPPAVVASGVAALAAVLLVGGVVGLGLGAAVAVLGPRLLARLEPQAVRRERERLEADLPLAMDLLAACLLGGAPLPAAVGAVAVAVPGPCGDRLGAVAAALAVGSPAAEAWQALTAPAVGPRGGAHAGPPGGELAPAAVRALVRAAETGTPSAAAVGRLATEARALTRARGEEAAERAAVLAVGPLGLCFLPAFVLLGIVPVVAGLVGPLLAGL